MKEERPRRREGNGRDAKYIGEAERARDKAGGRLVSACARKAGFSAGGGRCARQRSIAGQGASAQQRAAARCLPSTSCRPLLPGVAGPAEPSDVPMGISGVASGASAPQKGRRRPRRRINTQQCGPARLGQACDRPERTRSGAPAARFLFVSLAAHRRRRAGASTRARSGASEAAELFCWEGLRRTVRRTYGAAQRPRTFDGSSRRQTETAERDGRERRQRQTTETGNRPTTDRRQTGDRPTTDGHTGR